MPICFKCGKNLATDQSLQYHLQKRVKCNTLNCTKCKKQFPNKLLLDNHKHECSYTSSNSSRYEIFDQIQSQYIYIIELNKDFNIKYISDNYKYKKEEIMNKNINTIMKLDTTLNNYLTSTEIKHNNNNFDISIKYNDDHILLINLIKE